MKHLLLYLILVLFAVGCVHTDSDVKYEPQLSDTIYTADAALAIFDRNPERALLMLDSAVIVGNLDEDLAKMLRAKVLSQSTADLHFDEALQICEELMQSDFVDNPANRENVLDLLITITRRRGDNEQWVRWSTEKVDLCRQQGDETEALRTEAEIGFILVKLGEEERGLAKINGVIGALDEQRHFNEMGQDDIARRYLSLFEESDYGKTFSGRMMASNTWRVLGDYDKMLAIYDVATKRLGTDTLNIDFSTMLYGRAVAAEARGDYKAATGYWHRYNNIKQQLDRKQYEGQAYHYAARYKLQEEHMNTEREQAKAQYNKTLAWAGFILVILSVGFIIHLLIQRRAIDRKNRVLTEQMMESVKYKKEISQNSKLQTPHSTLQTKGVEELNDEQLFEYLSNVIRNEELFLNPNFGRQMLIDRFHLTDRRVGAAFAHGGSHNSLPDFIRDLRLEYACQLFTDHPDRSISEVAESSGFSNLTVFGRDFKRKYEVTPTYFRSQMISKK